MLPRELLLRIGHGAPLRVLVSLLLLTLVQLAGSPCRAQSLPDQIVQDLKRNAASLNPLTVSWDRKRRSGLALEPLLDVIQSRDEKHFLEPEHDTVIYQQEKLWVNTKGAQWAGKKLVMINSDTAFDGELVYVSDSTTPIASVVIMDPAYLATQPDHFLYYCEYLEAAGFRVHNRHGTFRRPPESEVLSLIGRGGTASSVRNSVLDSDQCVEVEVTLPEGRRIFWLDQARQHAVRKHEHYNKNGALVRTTINSQFEELRSPRVWLPRRSLVRDHTWHTIPDKVFKDPILTTSLEVTDLSRKTWPSDRFVIDQTRSGTFVLDSRQETAKQPGAVLRADGMYHYRVPAKPEDLARAVGVGNSRLRTLFVWLNGIAAALVLAYLRIFRRSRRPS